MICPNLSYTWKYNVLCPNLRYVRKYVMSELMLYTKIWCLVSELMLHTKFHQNIPCGSRDRASSLFRNLDLGKASTEEKCHLAIPWLDLVNINGYANFYQNIPHGSRVMSNFHKLITDGHTTSQTAHGQINKKLKEQEISFLHVTQFLINWAQLWSFIKLSCTV